MSIQVIFFSFEVGIVFGLGLVKLYHVKSLIRPFINSTANNFMKSFGTLCLGLNFVNLSCGHVF